MSHHDLGAKYDQIYVNYGQLTSPDTPPEFRIEPLKAKGWPTNLREAVVYLARPGGKLLEIGCGAGAVLATLAPYYAEVVGIDISATLADYSRRGLAHVAHCTVLNVSLEQAAEVVAPPFDCIVWADVIEHVVDVIGAMKLVAALARPGTQLVTVTPNVAFLPHRLRLLAGHAPTTGSHYSNAGFMPDPRQTILHDAGHLHYFTFTQVEMLYRLAGFRPQQRLGIASRFSRLRHLWPSLLSSSVCVAGSYEG
jgi:2-polyprenyl-3-methyl-5-hydroxy-6-metoxy-1,4-benzoquinol methylase